jgi:hypothetical protein
MTEGVTSITLNETDRELVGLAAWILAALDPGPTRGDAFEAIAQAYRDDVAEAHAGTDPGTLHALAEGFGGALLFEMEHVCADRAEIGPLQTGIVSPADRGRVIEALQRYLDTL